MFSCKIYEINLRKPFFTEHLLWLRLLLETPTHQSIYNLLMSFEGSRLKLTISAGVIVSYRVTIGLSRVFVISFKRLSTLDVLFPSIA